MNAISKEHFLKYIDHNFKDGDIIFENNWKLQAMWEQFGDEYFIEDGRWGLTNKCDKWGD